jgi:hypothetical protein
LAPSGLNGRTNAGRLVDWQVVHDPSLYQSRAVPTMFSKWQLGGRSARQHVLKNPADAYAGAGWSLVAYCGRCGRTREIVVADVARPNETMHTLCGRLRCGRCRMPAATADLVMDGGDRRRTERVRLVGPESGTLPGPR